MVIPTTGRRRSLLTALDSALQQPETREVVVVYNGGHGDPDVLAGCGREGVRLVERHDIRGCGPARHVGIELAEAAWVAFLDDDDVWLPGKLAEQVAATAAFPQVRLVMSHAVWRLPDRDKVMPQRPPRRGETLADYTFVVGSRARHGLASPPSMLVERHLLTEVPWWLPGSDDLLDRHEDMQWAARASAVLRPEQWRVLDSVGLIVHRSSPDSISSQALTLSASVAADEQRWLDLVLSALHPGSLSTDACRSFRLTHVWPYVPRLTRQAWADAVAAPWAALVGGWRRWRRHRAHTER